MGFIKRRLKRIAMKAFTSLEQSRKLAEILPLESADMAYIKHSSSDNPIWEFNEDFPPMILGNVPINEVTVEALPCWSLAALISIIPQELFNGEYIINITEGLNHKWIISYEHYSEVSSYIDVSSNSLIDCCVEMIIKLKERNLL